ncbi:hypothetical protein NDU88_005584 [Pleurodeles waltl]|uniref:Uncharacterized protein n=1 Tax=Pleurodeles waltl TaxID=8319 RepID=A0AAV7VKA6_PLEWA|nr:hypothetical protein NDU88_005584 [Pleurodeles waltl]
MIPSTGAVRASLSTRSRVPMLPWERHWTLLARISGTLKEKNQRTSRRRSFGRSRRRRRRKRHRTPRRRKRHRRRGGGKDAERREGGFQPRSDSGDPRDRFYSN